MESVDICRQPPKTPAVQYFSAAPFSLTAGKGQRQSAPIACAAVLPPLDNLPHEIICCGSIPLARRSTIGGSRIQYI